MTEAELDTEIRRLCAADGVRWFRVRDSRHVEPAGWPDLVLWRPGGHLIFRELKADDGRVSRGQQEIGYSLREAGQDWDIWRPADLRGGLVAAELYDLWGTS